MNTRCLLYKCICCHTRSMRAEGASSSLERPLPASMLWSRVSPNCLVNCPRLWGILLCLLEGELPAAGAVLLFVFCLLCYPFSCCVCLRVICLLLELF